MSGNPLDRLPKTTGGSAFGWHFQVDWKNCQTYWWNRNLRPHPLGGVGVEPGESRIPLAVGTSHHKFLELWYLSGWRDGEDSGERDFDMAIAGARASLVEEGFDPDTGTEDAINAWATVEQLANQYVGQYGPGGRSEEWPAYKVLGDQNGLPYIERELALDLGYNGYVLTVRMDLIVTSSMGLVSLEHKSSAASLAGRLLDRFGLDGQATTQALMMDAHFPNQPIAGVELNVSIKDRAARSPLPANIRRMTYRTPAQLEKFILDARRTMKRIDESVAYYEDLIEKGMDPDEAARVTFDGNPSGYQCVGAFGKCPYYDLCANREVSETIVANDFMPRTYEKRWENPYATKRGLVGNRPRLFVETKEDG